MREIIRWEKFAGEAYLYGTEMTFLENGQVVFKNLLMPSGQIINRWRSKMHYQAYRIQPNLPLLRKGEDYKIDMLAMVKPQGSIYIKIDFLDRFDQLIGFKVLKNDDRQFTYPKEAYSYHVSLVNAGCVSLVFENLLLTSVEKSEV